MAQNTCRGHNSPHQTTKSLPHTTKADLPVRAGTCLVPSLASCRTSSSLGALQEQEKPERWARTSAGQQLREGRAPPPKTVLVSLLGPQTRASASLETFPALVFPLRLPLQNSTEAGGPSVPRDPLLPLLHLRKGVKLSQTCGCRGERRSHTLCLPPAERRAGKEEEARPSCTRTSIINMIPQ